MGLFGDSRTYIWKCTNCGDLNTEDRNPGKFYEGGCEGSRFGLNLGKAHNWVKVYGE